MGEQRSLNLDQNAAHMTQHITVPEAQDTIAKPFDLTRAHRVIRTSLMLTTIDFDYQFRATADKVHDKRADRRLPSKM